MGFCGTLGLMATAHPAAALTCGLERWGVKTGTDPDAAAIHVHESTATTVDELVAIPAPASPPENWRVPPIETTVFVVDAQLTGGKYETDSDYHLVLQGANRATMIAEITEPGCVDASSPLLEGIQRARSEFDATLHATSMFKAIEVPVRVTGVGFFDHLHGQTGVAPNGIELHPVLDIQFYPSPRPRPTVTPATGNTQPAQGQSSGASLVAPIAALTGLSALASARRGIRKRRSGQH